jgi:hypothetical protein
MQSDGLAARRRPVRVVVRAGLVAGILIGILGCSETPTRPRDTAEPAADTPMVGSRPVNINEQLVATTMGAGGLVAPYRVIGIRLGVFGDMKGLAVDDRAAAADWLGAGRTELDDTVWQVDLVGTQPPRCPDGACDDRTIRVEAYVTENGRYVIAITMRELVPGDPLIPGGG